MPPPFHHHPQEPGRTPPSPPSSKPNSRLLSLFLKAVIMTFLTSFFFFLLPLASLLLLLPHLLRHRRRRRFHCPPSSGFSPRHLRKLSQFRFCQETASRYSDSGCVVCLDGFRQGQLCRKLFGCGHVFHRKCVDLWLLKVAACPICRERVWADEDRSIWGFGSRRIESRVC